MAKHIWYSGATDVTGRALAEALELNGTREKPRNLRADDILIGWGTKIQRDTQIPNNVHILNHPNAIRKCRNKYEAAKLMAADRDMAQWTTRVFTKDEIARSIAAGDTNFPVVGRKNFHQGGKDFWLCLTSSQLEAALNDGAQYFRPFIDIKTEYRLHVFGDRVIYAVKKVESPGDDHWAEQRKKKVLDYAAKNNVNLDNDTIDYVLQRLAKEVQLPDRIVRSNRRGWKFSNVRVNSLSQNLKNAARKSVEVLGLDFGAVDCATTQNNSVVVLEVNSGPGLEGTTLEKYIEAFRNKIAELERPAPAPRQARQNAPRVQAAAAEAAVERDEPVAGNGAEVNANAVRLLMNNVQNDEEARRVLDIMMGRG